MSFSQPSIFCSWWPWEAAAVGEFLGTYLKGAAALGLFLFHAEDHGSVIVGSWLFFAKVSPEMGFVRAFVLLHVTAVVFQHCSDKTLLVAELCN